MARTFYTERDIEDLAKRGVTEIPVDDSVYITDSAREMMDKLGIKRRVNNGSAASAALKSPDAAKPTNKPTASAPSSSSQPLTDAERQQVIDQVKSGVLARLGPGVDAAVVDQIVRKVVGKL